MTNDDRFSRRLVDNCDKEKHKMRTPIYVFSRMDLSRDFRAEPTGVKFWATKTYLCAFGAATTALFPRST
jgi:hypothetical protein